MALNLLPAWARSVCDDCWRDLALPQRSWRQMLGNCARSKASVPKLEIRLSRGRIGSIPPRSWKKSPPSARRSFPGRSGISRVPAGTSRRSHPSLRLGRPSVLASSQLGVVGTRKPSHYAAECAKKLSYQLAYAGITVTSGLARGVDALAHQAAIAARGRTIAVLGSGLNNLYPPENRELAEKIAITGAVVSEFPMDTKPDPRQFPMRNRIISGLSFGLLVSRPEPKAARSSAPRRPPSRGAPCTPYRAGSINPTPSGPTA